MRKRLYLFLLLISPFVWWLVGKTQRVFEELLLFPDYFRTSLLKIFTEEKLVNTGLMRWAELDSGPIFIISKLLYNRGTVIIGEFFSLLTFLSPRFYFQAGDHSKFTPQVVEPIPLIFFPFFVFGLYLLIKQKSFKFFIYVLFFALIGYLAGAKSFSYLFPVALLFVFFVKEGLSGTKSKYRQAFLLMSFIYSLYLGGRIIWLVF